MWRKLLLLSSLLVACVGDEPETSNVNAVPFTGTWKTSTASQKVDGCILAQQIPDQDAVAITYSVAGSTDASADVTLSNDIAPGCVLKAKITGKVAQLIEGNTCTSNPAPNVKFIYKYLTTSVFELSADNKTATFNLFASFTQERDGSDTGYTCAFTERSPLTKN